MLVLVFFGTTYIQSHQYADYILSMCVKAQVVKPPIIADISINTHVYLMCMYLHCILKSLKCDVFTLTIFICMVDAFVDKITKSCDKLYLYVAYDCIKVKRA
jgi:hypothetical protein